MTDDALARDRLKVEVLHPRRDAHGRPIAPADVRFGRRHPTAAEAAADYTVAWEGHVDPDVLREHAALGGHGTSDQAFLEDLWASVERGGAGCPIPRLVSQEDSIRSFHVGDMVRLDGDRVYVCDNVGWSRLDPGQPTDPTTEPDAPQADA